MKQQNKALLFAITAILLWSTVATAFKIALKTIHFTHLLFFVSIISALLFFVLIIFENKLSLVTKTNGKQLITSALLSFLNPFIYYLFVFYSYAVLEAQIAQPLNYTWPVMLVILSIPLLKQKITLFEFLALILSFLGVVFISSSGNLSNFKLKEPLGIILALCSSIVWALFWIYNVKDKRPDLIKLFFTFLFGSLYTFIYCLMTNNLPTLPGKKEIFVLIYIGFFEMGFTYFLWMKAMKLTSATVKIGNLVFISPFLSLVFLHLFIGEQIYYTTILGLVCIVSGIIIQRYLSIKHSK